MINEILILFLFAFVGFFLLVKPSLIPYISVFGFIFIPVQIFSYLGGGDGTLESTTLIKNHPITYSIILSCTPYLFKHRKKLRGLIMSHRILRWIITSMIIFCASSLIETFVIRGLKGLPTALENYIGPLIFFLFLYTHFHNNEQGSERFLKFFVTVILLAGSYSVIEYLLQNNIVFGRLYENFYWYRSFEGDAYRVSSILGHPLVNANYYLVAALLVPIVNNRLYRYLLLIIFIAGIIVTGSRAAIVIYLVMVIVSYLLNKASFLKRIGQIFTIFFVLIAVYVLVFLTPIGSTIVERFQSAEGSTLVRFLSIGFLYESLISPNLIGNGFGGSAEVAYSIFKTYDYGFENPWLILILDCGIVIAAIYLIVILLISLSVVKNGAIRNDLISRTYFVSIIGCQIFFFTYNSFGTRSLMNYLFWIVVAGSFIHERIKWKLLNS